MCAATSFTGCGRIACRPAIDLVLFIIFMVPGFGALFYYGIPYAAQSWHIHEVSIYAPTGAPVYPHKTLIPIAACADAAAMSGRDHPLHHLHARRGVAATAA